MTRMQRESRSAATYTMYIARLLTQEIALVKDVHSPRRAFELQSRLLKDAFLETSACHCEESSTQGLSARRRDSPVKSK